MNGMSNRGIPLLSILLLLTLAGCGTDKPGMQTPPASVAQQPSPPSLPSPPPPAASAPAPAAAPVRPPDAPPAAVQPAQPKTQQPAVPQAPAATPQAPAATPQAPAATPQAPAATPQAPAAASLEKARMSKADNLFEKPFTDARIIARLNGGQDVELLKREGSWYQLRAAGQQGWVRMLSVRRTAPAAMASTDSLGQMATGRAGTGQIVTTTGVRGLGEETLKEAAFSEAAIAAAEHFRMKPAAAERLARAQGLAPRQIPALPATAAGAREGGAP